MMKKLSLLVLGFCLATTSFAKTETTTLNTLAMLAKDNTSTQLLDSTQQVTMSETNGKGQENLQIGFYAGATVSCFENMDKDVKHQLYKINRHSALAGGMIWVSKEFHPCWGWRASIGIAGDKGRSNYFEAEEYHGYKFKNAEAFVDLTYDLADAIWPSRKHAFNFKVFGGVGGAYCWGIPKVSEQIAQNPSYREDYPVDLDNKHAHIGGRLGAIASWRLTDYWRLNATLVYNMFDDHYNGWKDNFHCDVREDMMIGLSYTFKDKKKAAPVVEPVAPVIPEKVEEKVEQPKEEVAVVPVEEPVVVQEKVDTPAVDNIEELTIPLFFSLRQSNILPANDEKIQRLVNFVNTHKSSKITVKGYADKGTGNPKVNIGYSRSRAQKTAAELVKKYNISPDQLEVSWYGDTVQPFEENDKNRCSILSVKEIR